MSATERIRITNWSLSPPLPGRTYSVADSSAAYHLVRSSSLLSTHAICSQQACDFTLIYNSLFTALVVLCLKLIHGCGSLMTGINEHHDASIHCLVELTKMGSEEARNICMHFYGRDIER